eukprot:gnl/TRDRNA2_/TRDRNA2_166335_c0_seq1.p3 gnl/TRDRNA2_/TRDRNA2_166335_c0~~gnl/TRDRNA2_/TRDRNA2_166335_c0_seq1.p3  ORF type:complete len:104 (+),score=0.78 gnl/TRDRNA2_/TRDRNA2_166335_c0_seq1:72-383(+)
MLLPSRSKAYRNEFDAILLHGRPSVDTSCATSLGLPVPTPGRFFAAAGDQPWHNNAHRWPPELSSGHHLHLPDRNGRPRLRVEPAGHGDRDSFQWLPCCIDHA